MIVSSNSPTPCPNQSTIVVVSAQKTDMASTVFAGNVKLARRLDNIVAMRVRSFQVSLAAGDMLDTEGFLIGLFSSYLGSLLAYNPFQLGSASNIGVIETVVTAQSNLIGLATKTSMQTGLPTFLELNPKMMKFNGCKTIQNFDWAMQDFQMPFKNGPVVTMELVLEFFPDCACECR